MHRPSAAASALAKSAKKSGTKGAKKAPISILIVEDQVVAAVAMSLALLGEENYEVIGIASSPQAALEAAAERVPDLVIMDISLGYEKDGIDVARELQERYGLPVVYATGQNDPVTVERAKTTKPRAYLVKPFTTQELEAAVQYALSSAA